MSNHNSGRTFYDILEVPADADASAIRKSYLKKSLKYHPDKNPNNPEEAKAKFIQIGEAYETLSDPVKRRAYDRELRSSGGRPPKTNFSGGATTADPQAYDNYMDAFDATVAGMSEEELAAMMGAVSALAGIVGSLVGSRVLGGSNKHKQRSAGGTAKKSGLSTGLSAAGSMVGGLVASELASSSVRALHQDSINRLNYKQECRRAVERGEPMPEPPKTSFIGNKIGDILKEGVNIVTGDGMGNSNINHNNNRNSYDQNQRDSFNGQQGGGNVNPVQNLWKMAAAGVKAAQAANQR